MFSACKCLMQVPLGLYILVGRFSRVTRSQGCVKCEGYAVLPAVFCCHREPTQLCERVEGHTALTSMGSTAWAHGGDLVCPPKRPSLTGYDFVQKNVRRWQVCHEWSKAQQGSWPSMAARSSNAVGRGYQRELHGAFCVAFLAGIRC